MCTSPQTHVRHLTSILKQPLQPEPVMISLTTIRYLSVNSTDAVQLSGRVLSGELCHDIGNCRTSWDIVSSCVATILSCTWLAIHPNVPKQGKGKFWKFWRHIGHFIVALIAPEVIVAFAWNERIAARKIAFFHKGTSISLE